MTPLGRTIRDLRYDRKMSQEELAQQAEISIRTLQHIESGVTPTPRIDTVAKIAAVLGVSVTSLLSESKHDAIRRSSAC